ncbi:MAG TPA: hypothetical protein VK427_23115, partial [Kofleriaceae bacterium]|nr:hypothetical protein [Kofleriaceae bacterium]
MLTSTQGSIRRLRAVILFALTVGISLYTIFVFSLVSPLSNVFGPQVEADLAWRAVRGAKELSRAIDLGLAMSDTAMVEEGFGAYAASSDVQAIVAVDAANQVVAQHGKIDDLSTVFAAKPGVLVTTSRYVACWAPVVIEGNAVGKVVMVVSTSRLDEAQNTLSSVEQTTLVAGGVGLMLGCVFVLFFTRAVRIRDEQLQDYAANLERKVAERTRELDERNQGMQLVLDNVAQGFMTISLDGEMARERSAIVERWFGPIRPHTKFDELVRPFAPEFSAWFELMLDLLRTGSMPYDCCIAQMPKRFERDDRTYDVAVTPLMEGARPGKLLLIVTDVTP